MGFGHKWCFFEDLIGRWRNLGLNSQFYTRVNFSQVCIWHKVDPGVEGQSGLEGFHWWVWNRHVRPSEAWGLESGYLVQLGLGGSCLGIPAYYFIFLSLNFCISISERNKIRPTLLASHRFQVRNMEILSEERAEMCYVHASCTCTNSPQGIQSVCAANMN